MSGYPVLTNSPQYASAPPTEVHPGDVPDNKHVAPPPYPPGYSSSPYPPSSGPPPPVLVQPPPVFVTTPMATTVIVSDTPHWSTNPQRLICPHCRQDVVTRIKYVPGMLTWIIALVIFLFGGWLFCLCLIPFCINDCQDVEHYCPNCKQFLGKKKF